MPSTIQLFRPTVGEEEVQAVAEVLRSGWLGLGPKTEEFEKAFAAYVGAKFVVGTISCTSALDLAIKMLNLRPGDEIVVPAITFISSAHAIVYNQCRPVFVDVEPDTLNISVNDLERKISARTKAIVAVHYSGRPVDLDAVAEVAGGIPIIEDCAHATGSQYKGRSVGTFGKYGCFSFHAVKNLTMGEGGAISINDSDDYQRARQLRWLGIDKGTWERTPDNKEYWWEYSVNEIGLKCHLNDILAAIGLEQLKKVDRLNARRRQIGEIYRREFAGLDWLEMPPPDDEVFRSAWHIFCAKLRRHDRNEFSQHLREQGIMTGVHYKPIHLYHCYGHQEPLPVAEAIFKRIISLPNHASLSDDDVSRIVEAVRRFVPTAKSPGR